MALALRASMRTATITFLLLTAACSPAQRTVVGGGIALVGVGVTSLAVDSMAGSCSQGRDGAGVCRGTTSKPTSFSAGAPVALGGVGIAILGGAIMLTADDHGSTGPTATVAPPAPAENPTPLDKTEAIGMAIARLLVAGMGNHGRMELLEVDGAQSGLIVDTNHAELRDLRVQLRKDRTWITLSACYEFEDEWRVTSLEEVAGCGPHSPDAAQ